MSAWQFAGRPEDGTLAVQQPVDAVVIQTTSSCVVPVNNATLLPLHHHKKQQRGRKRHWKEAYHSSSDEVAALHTQLLAQHKNMEALESRLRQLHTELALLSIGTTTTTTASSAAGRRGGQQRSPRSRPGTAGESRRVRDTWGWLRWPRWDAAAQHSA